MQIEIYVQARMASTRLPGKVLKPVLGKPLLQYLWERVQRVQKAAAAVILTTTNPLDDQIIAFCKQHSIPFFRGPEEDVLARYAYAAKERHPDAIVRITADCPCIDPALIDHVIDAYVKEYPAYDYVSNTLKRTYPRGMDVEVFSIEALTKAFNEAQTQAELEHVTPYIYQHPEQFRMKNIVSPVPLEGYRWTVDTPEDFELISRIITELYPRNPQFSLQDILDLLSEHPQWNAINAHVKQKPTS